MIDCVGRSRDLVPIIACQPDVCQFNQSAPDPDHRILGHSGTNDFRCSRTCAVVRRGSFESARCRASAISRRENGRNRNPSRLPNESTNSTVPVALATALACSGVTTIWTMAYLLTSGPVIQLALSTSILTESGARLNWSFVGRQKQLRNDQPSCAQKYRHLLWRQGMERTKHGWHSSPDAFSRIRAE